MGTVGELHLQLEQPAFPDRLVLARDGAVPAFEVERALRRLHGPGDEAEGVVFAPVLAARRTSDTARGSDGWGAGGDGDLPLLGEAGLAERHACFCCRGRAALPGAASDWSRMDEMGVECFPLLGGWARRRWRDSSLYTRMSGASEGAK